MSKIALIEIKDEVNIRIKNVDQNTLKEAANLLTFYVPNYMFTPTYRMGRWDGKIRLLSMTGKTCLNLLPDIFHVFENSGYTFDVDDQRRDFSHVVIDLPTADMFSQYEIKGESVILRDYQINGATLALTEGKGLLEMSVGSGKTLTCAAMAKCLMPHGNVIVIVPNIDLVIQTKFVFKQVGIDTGIWYGEAKDRRHVTISTWQSLEGHPELFSDVIGFVLDEAHLGTGKTISTILNGPGANVPFRIGCTGTVPKEDIFRYQLLASIGPILFTLATWELQKRGILANALIHQIVLKDTKNPRYRKYITEKRLNDQGDEVIGFEDWNEQVNFLYSDQKRLQYIANEIQRVSLDGNTLVLVQFREMGKKLEELIPNAVSIDGRDKTEFRKEEYDKFANTDGNILIATMGIASTGLDIPRIFHLFVLEPGKKFHKIIQALGRGVRKASDKDFIDMYDLYGDDGFSKKHGKERYKHFKDARQTVEVLDVDYVDIE